MARKPLITNTLTILVLCVCLCQAWGQSAKNESAATVPAGKKAKTASGNVAESAPTAGGNVVTGDKTSSPQGPQASPYAEKALRRAERLSGSVDLLWPSPGADQPPEPSATATAHSLLTQMSRSKDAATRRQAVEGLSRLKAPESAQPLLEALLDESAEVRAAAANALAESPPDEAMAGVMGVLTGGSPEAIASLEGVLPRLKGALERPMLEAVMDATGPPERQMGAAFALGRMRSAAATQVLIDLSWTGEPRVAFFGAEALAYMADPKTVPALVDMLKHSDPIVRQVAVQGLGRIGGPTATEALVRVATTPDESRSPVRREAVAALGRMGGPEMVPVLIRGMAVPDLGVRREAGAALRRITGMELRDEPGLWQAWYMEQQAAEAAAKQPPPLLPSGIRIPILPPEPLPEGLFEDEEDAAQ